MAQKKSYSRYFIILQEDEPGYALASDKLPSGYTKLETKNDKCKVSYYVQNLRKDKEPYYMVLICSKKDTRKLIKLGTLNIDDYGRAEINYEFNSDNVSGSKMPVDVIGGSAIVRIEGNNIVPVMSGFASTDSPKDWRGYSLYEEKKEELRSEAKEADIKEAAIKKAAAKVEEKVDTVENREETNKVSEEKKNIFEEYEQKIEDIKQEQSERNEAVIQEVKEEDIVEVQADQEEVRVEVPADSAEEDASEERVSLEEIRHKHHHHDDDKEKKKCGCEEKKKCGCEDKKDYPTGTVGDFFKLLTDDFEEVKEICTEIKKCRWYKVPVKCLENMHGSVNYNKYTVVYYPMVSYYPYIKRHGHYMLGYKYDSKGKMKYLVYAIPGTKSRADQPFEGKSGFVTWVPAKEGDEREDSFGYWLMFYDFRTSTIVIPVK